MVQKPRKNPMRIHTWSSTPKGGTSHEFSIEMPTTIDETELIDLRFGSTERMIVEGVRQWTVDVAAEGRKILPDVPAAELYAANFCADGTKTRTAVRITADEAEEQDFSESQMAYLRSKGVRS